MRKDFFDNKLVRLVTVAGAFFGLLLMIVQIYEYLSPAKPLLNVVPFEENNTVFFYVYNGGDKIAQIHNYTLCLFDDKTKHPWIGQTKGDGQIFGEPFGILPKGFRIIDTKYDVHELQSLFIDYGNNWCVQICEDSIGCKVFRFTDTPQEKKEIIDTSLSIQAIIAVKPRLQDRD